MVGNSVFRFADWMLTTDPHGGPPLYEAVCTTCGETSGADASKDGPELWCLRHAGRTRHTGFQATTTSFFRASLVDVR
ncbi:hypothetical protein [Streptomyces sp. JJ38]|uniref:DUF7848 domain-containing protein n=1 Tax=Streptomyces sp. JJ38 TaxID=2738128 RepID=UPI001C5923D5|nr:hypothetical protein [Streptomyces sp. JJ38]MBW1596899.1 hypothetical protein [Streptomyces sp. JJ38]